MSTLKGEYLGRMRSIKVDLNTIRDWYDGKGDIETHRINAAAGLDTLSRRLHYLADNMRDGASDDHERSIR